jgi:6-phosphogluconate dehydrogenase
MAALDSGQPLTLIGEAVLRPLSLGTQGRTWAAARILPAPKTLLLRVINPNLLMTSAARFTLPDCLLRAGYQLMRAAAKEFGWNHNYGGIALMWRGGCIIRSAFLGKIKESFVNNTQLVNLLLDPFFAKAVADPKTHGDASSKRPYNLASPCQHLAALYIIMTATVQNACRPTFCRLNATISGPILRAYDKTRGQFFSHQLDRTGRLDVSPLLTQYK